MINLSNKPDWFLTINPKGGVPVLKVEDQVLTDSSDIVSYASQHSKQHLFISSGTTIPGSGIFRAFVEYLKSSSAAEEAVCREKLEYELSLLNHHLASAGTKYICGSNLSPADFDMAPKLYHIQVAGKALKKFEIPSRFSSLLNYMQSVKSSEVWKQTEYPPEYIIQGWKQHI